jgi:hypothetical protein
MQTIMGKRQKNGLPISSFVTQPTFSLLQLTGFLLCKVGIRGFALALQSAEPCVLMLELNSPSGILTCAFVLFCNRYKLVADNQRYLCGHFCAWMGVLIREKHKFPSIFLFPRFQRTVYGFSSKKFVPCLNNLLNLQNQISSRMKNTAYENKCICCFFYFCLSRWESIRRDCWSRVAE